ncbi:MAG TPA: PAS domain S-box protein [Candidatus Aminicenantes bacterium]|nr:PAS domain S-box protein [Candidatus Aminicenantes bacterium]
MQERARKEWERFLSLPVPNDSRHAQLADTIGVHLQGMILGYTILATALGIVLRWPVTRWAAMTGVPLAVNAGILMLARKGRWRAAAWALAVEYGLLVLSFAIVPGGIGARAAWAFFIVVFSAGMLLGRLAGLLAVVPCSLATLAIARFCRPPSPHPLAFWLINTLLLGLMAYLQYVAVGSARRTQARLQEERRARRRTEENWQECRRRQQEMLDALPFGIFEADLQGTVTQANRACLDAFGFDQEDLAAGINFYALVDDCDQPRVRENAEIIRAGGSVPFPEYRVRRKDGRAFTALIQTRCVHPDGEPAKLQGSLVDISDRKRIEEERELGISLLTATLESTADGILAVAMDGRIRHFNQRFMDMWRIPPDLLASGLNEQALTFVSVQLSDPERFLECTRGLDADPLAESFDLLEFRNGRFFERYSRPLLLAGRPIGRVWSFRDVTESRRAEREIAAWKQRFENAVAASNQVFYELEFASGRIVCSGSIHSVLGYDINETDYSGWKDMVAPEDREESFRLMEESMRTGATFVHEYGLRHARGHYVCMLDRGFVTRDASGRPQCMIGMLEDISERKRAELAITASEKRYRALFETAGDAIFLLHGSRAVECNDKTLELFACSRGEFSTADFRSFSPEKQPDGRISREALEKRLEAALAGKQQQFEWLHRRANGMTFPAEVTLKRLELSTGMLLLAVVRDISDRRLLEDQLLQAQKMEAIGILAGGVAHDFNNILSTIVGYATMLQTKVAENRTLKEYAEHILLSTERATSLTHSLLAFSRKQEVELRPVEVNDAIRAFHGILARLIGEDIVFRLELADQDLVVAADPRQLEQVLINLATNSRDAMSQGGTLTVSTSAVRLDEPSGEIPAGDFARIMVRDNGSGIDESLKSRVFEPFFTTKPAGHGTGLGLAIVYGIVKKHGGFINFESSPGRGTAFRIHLPLSVAERVPSPPSREEWAVRGTETILLVEDEAAVRQVMRAVLEEFGYRVIEAKDGKEGVALFLRERNRVNLVLCDLIMPGMNGRDTVNEIRGCRAGAKAIFVSGYAADVITQKGVVGGDVPLLLKPVKPMELLALVRQVLDS